MSVEKIFANILDENMSVHIVRNPYGYTEDEIRYARNVVCDRLESWRDAYWNMKQYAEDNGLDTTAYNR